MLTTVFGLKGIRLYTNTWHIRQCCYLEGKATEIQSYVYSRFQQLKKFLPKLKGLFLVTFISFGAA